MQPAKTIVLPNTATISLEPDVIKKKMNVYEAHERLSLPLNIFSRLIHLSPNHNAITSLSASRLKPKTQENPRKNENPEGYSRIPKDTPYLCPAPLGPGIQALVAPRPKVSWYPPGPGFAPSQVAAQESSCYPISHPVPHLQGEEVPLAAVPGVYAHVVNVESSESNKKEVFDRKGYSGLLIRVERNIKITEDVIFSITLRVVVVL